MGPDDVIYRKAPKLIELTFPVPAGYTGNISLRVTNTHYDDDINVDLCGIAVVKVGKNLPCVKLQRDVTVEMSDENKTVDG